MKASFNKPYSHLATSALCFLAEVSVWFQFQPAVIYVERLPINLYKK